MKDLMVEAIQVGLAGDSIPLEARIVCIADSFDAMTSDRSYRPRFTLYKALDEIEKCKGAQFDPELADIFIKLVKENKEKISEAVHIDFIERKED